MKRFIPTSAVESGLLVREGSMMRLSLPFVLVSVLMIVSGCVSTGGLHTRQFDNLAIKGRIGFCEQVEQALALMKARSPEGYATVTNYIGIIQEHKRSGMNVHHRPPMFQLNENSARVSVTWCAGVIAHDSFHSKLYFDYKHRHRPAFGVPAKEYVGERAERACSEHQIQVLTEIGAPASEIDWTRQCMTQTNPYWKVKYKDRNW